MEGTRRMHKNPENNDEILIIKYGRFILLESPASAAFERIVGKVRSHYLT
jgi:hypothetical protein